MTTTTTTTTNIKTKTSTKLAVTGCLAAILGVFALGATTGAPEGAPEGAQISPGPVAAEDDECPPGEASAGMGPEMVRLPDGFCIDTTEVTRGQYRAWLETTPSTEGQPSACAQNEDFEPSCAWPPPDHEASYPVVCVDWCDARAYCEAAGKRLCGQIGGGGYDFDSYDDASVSEWHAACTSGGEYDYTYGDALDTQICRGADAEDYTTWGFVEVGTLPGCHSPVDAYSGVYDLSGNAAEWDNGCDGDTPDSPCRIRGGSFEFNDVGLRCAMAADLRWPRMRQVVSVGFRCCAD
ncbi:Formylglycine-generating sulfatase enzyme [Enhygromyxa salina]|uniref:Formylglycine-generating sulfatase enzyme n=1 Tax=Enhygromyxa salina TaxID=215803 RepID=A0A2S9XE06_9BACT|nr:SUMF1/EgtB/PvdO family nonheme iron enzyme [Enhygromyxa salina]PRP91094.1 Formylglycine-generating sulfatase enzyme [Enhygromyxa salina]